MFSYRHAFHAGNHADVLKHLVLVHILDYYNQKDAPYWFIDLHAGAGLYDLEGKWAQTKGEFVDGIARIWDKPDAPQAVKAYLEQVAALNPDSNLRYYPGSPWIAQQMLRPTDKLRLFELHPSEVEILNLNLEAQGKRIPRQTTVFDTDGFAGLKGQLPPPPRRAVVLIDPSYEDKQDYRRTMDTLKDAVQRFATGCYVVWYPQIQRLEAQQMVRQLDRLDVKSWLHVSLTVKKSSPDGVGLNGSGMFIVNPPYTLKEALKPAMPWMVKMLGQDDRALYKLDDKSA
ncbi:23S rRNA (adenine2030-N6)-methyltransferase [Jezberella montanilacus]|uniref:Ribosomal RNA large subunit methyltransferase J n=1 Tax=Jezberella montanilacus TaxID=323426 RepID=A0A2T0XJ83_9BURK|nr:23S rRNA (adenine(2030)-N(6))-methyltransferase RlmJ [Jezberella montanilacus]PRY99024.1 23S rRNA (adenine2030-N6)-methyltransferase [Jezberella montanilacus]